MTSAAPFAAANPEDVQAAPISEDAARFEQQWREALNRAADSLDLTEVFDVLDRCRHTAWLTTTRAHAGYRQLLADADHILTRGERPDDTVPWNDLRTRIGQ